jgi:outer membrane protein TolC
LLAKQGALEFSTKLNFPGETHFLSVLNAQRSLFGSESAVTLSHLALANDLNSLYKALGGGW